MKKQRSQGRDVPASKGTANRKYVYICSHGGCTNKARGRSGVCIKHGAKAPTCSVTGCTNNSLAGRRCKRHGAKVAPRKKCSHEGCNNQAVKGGVCTSHGANTTPTVVEGTRHEYSFVGLPRGTSEKLQTEAKQAVRQIEGESVVNCEDGVYQRLKPKYKAQLCKRPDDNFYTDNCRIQSSFECPGGLKYSIQNVLQRDIRRGYVLRRGNVLVTRKSRGKHPLRQQLHWDFEGRLRRWRFFVIIPLDNDQSIFVSDEDGNLSRLRLRKDCAFVGRGGLVHCGSETPGMRVHFEFIPQRAKIDDDVKTRFAPDPTYPLS